MLVHDYFIHDAVHHRLVGRRTQQTYTLGDMLKVKLLKADPLKGSLIFEVVLEDNLTNTNFKKAKKLKFKRKKKSKL